MAHWKNRFPSKYAQASDFDEGPIDVTIKSVDDELIGTGERAELKPVLSFREPNRKAVVLNQARAESIAQIAGTPDTDQWSGVRVRLQQGTTRFQGKTVPCTDIVAPPVAKRAPARKASTTAPEPDVPDPDADDEVGF